MYGNLRGLALKTLLSYAKIVFYTEQLLEMRRDYGAYAHYLLGFVAGLLLMIGIIYAGIYNVQQANYALCVAVMITCLTAVYQALESKNLYEIYEDIVLEFGRGLLAGLAGGLVLTLIISALYQS